MTTAPCPAKRTKVFRWGTRAASLVGLVLLAGCAGLHPTVQPLPPKAVGAWLDLLSVDTAVVEPGMELVLPRAPYRAQFADRDGIYYAASQRIQLRSSHGVSQEIEGGLYVRHDQPDYSHVWLAPVVGRPALPYESLRWSVRIHRP